MTLRSHKKPPTTVWSPWTKTESKPDTLDRALEGHHAPSIPRLPSVPRPTRFAAALVALLAAGLAASGDSSIAADPDPQKTENVTTAEYVASETEQRAHVVPVAHSTGRTAPKLKWLPAPASRSARPTRSAGGDAPIHRLSTVQTAQFTLPVPDAAVQAGATDPFDDPFGDAKKVVRRNVAAKPLDDRALDADKAPLTPGGSLLQLPPSIDTPPEPEGFRQDQDLNDLLAREPSTRVDDCRTPADLKAIDQIGYDVTPLDGTFPQECRLGDEPLEPRAWAPVTFMWKATGLCHKPAYFDDVHLERYGHSAGPYTQPLLSAAHFFLTVPVLPYKMGLYPPGECMYTLGYYRPGSCAPYLLDPLPLSLRAAVAEAGVWTGMAFLVP